MALPLHPEYRTVPMLFYVPPMLPVLAAMRNGRYETVDKDADGLAPMLSSLEQARVPLRYMASLLSGGNEELVKAVYRKQIAVRIHMRSHKVGDVPADEVAQAFFLGKTEAGEAEAIHRLTSLPTFEERFVVPPMAREMAIDEQFPALDPLTHKTSAGFGSRKPPHRRW